MRHGVKRDLVAEQDTKLYQIHKAEYRERLAKLDEHEEAKSLRKEISLIRLLIEERFNLIQNDSDLLAACGTLNSLVLTAERLVQSAHKLEASLGTVLDKSTLYEVGDNIVTLLVKELKDVPGYEDIVTRIGEQMILIISKASGKAVEE
jgi:hypothetical protein